jgi:hypothetical protein
MPREASDFVGIGEMAVFTMNAAVWPVARRNGMPRGAPDGFCRGAAPRPAEIPSRSPHEFWTARAQVAESAGCFDGRYVARSAHPVAPQGLYHERMNREKLRKNVGWRVQLAPSAIHLDALGRVVPARNEDWIIQQVTDTDLRLARSDHSRSSRMNKLARKLLCRRLMPLADIGQEMMTGLLTVKCSGRNYERIFVASDDTDRPTFFDYLAGVVPRTSAGQTSDLRSPSAWIHGQSPFSTFKSNLRPKREEEHADEDCR